jgi:outer membrane receptor protein involved in Fe transport
MQSRFRLVLHYLPLMKSIRLIIALTVSALSKQAVAQTNSTTPSSDAAATGEVVQLPAFEIKSDNDTGYVGKSSLSSTRIAVDLADLPQSVKVLNSSFLQAINPMNMSDMLNFVGGAQNGQLFISPGRVNIRGFTGEADYVDGFAPPANSTPESANFDRFEVIKGPSTIFLAADGSPGGVHIDHRPSRTIRRQRRHDRQHRCAHLRPSATLSRGGRRTLCRLRLRLLVYTPVCRDAGAVLSVQPADEAGP